MNEEAETLVIESPPHRLLKIPTGWAINKNTFSDLSPNAKPKFKAYPNDNGWGLFDFELIIFEYAKLSLYLDMGWKPANNPNGQFIMKLVTKEGWEEIERFETRSLKEITKAINNLMLRISLKHKDYDNYPSSSELQNLTPFTGWRYVKNEFFDIEPYNKLNNEDWKLFIENLLYIEHRLDEKIKIEMGWFPAFKPSGEYRAKLINENLENPLLEEFSTKNKDEIAEYINQAMAEKVNLLSSKREKSERDRRRQLKLQMQRNQKV